MASGSAPLPRNARLFVAFRILFNARFYYPVLAVLFVDLGLTLDQYALLNVAWAVSIVLAELPLGALGDTIGRRPLIVMAAGLMVVEMAVLAFAPTGDPTLLFCVFLVNRVLSGIAEAAASGADEALAYDTLLAEGRESEWPDVLARLGRRVSVAFVVSMILGAAVYDPALVQSACNRLGLDVTLTQKATARFPVYLTLGLALGALAVALSMREVGERRPKRPSLRETTHAILSAGGWILRTRFALALLLFSLVLDTGVRVFLTMTSTYYRAIGIPEGAFGLLGAAFALLGFFAVQPATHLVRHRSGRFNYALVVALMVGGLAGVASVHAWWSIAFLLPMAFGFRLLDFFGSHYLNACTDSSRRATVLSFRSLANNLAYGAAGWGFALLMRTLAGGERPPPGSRTEETLFLLALVAAPMVVAVFAIPLWLWASSLSGMKQRPG